jgi:hypothetical protein
MVAEEANDVLALAKVQKVVLPSGDPERSPPAMTSRSLSARFDGPALFTETFASAAKRLLSLANSQSDHSEYSTSPSIDVHDSALTTVLAEYIASENSVRGGDLPC